MTPTAPARRRTARTVAALSILALVSTVATTTGAATAVDRSDTVVASTASSTTTIAFPGGNGSPWPVQYSSSGWTAGSSTTRAYQENGQGRLYVNGGGSMGSAAVQRYAAHAAGATLDSVEYLGEVTVPTSREAFASLYVSSNQDLSRYVGLHFDPWGARLFGKTATGVAYSQHVPGPALGSTVNVRVRRTGGTVSARWWTGSTEPTTWRVQHSGFGDASLSGLPGYAFGLGTGEAARANEVRFGRATLTSTGMPSVVSPAPVTSPTAAPTTPAPAPTSPTATPTTSPTAPATTAPAPTAPVPPATSRVVFPQAKAFWDPIRSAPRLDANSSAIKAKLAEAGRMRVALLYRYGSPIVEADASTPRYTLNVRYQGTGPGMWGFNDLATGTVPIPDGALPSTGTDGKMTIVDWSTRKVYDLWQMEKTGSTWTVSWGGVYPLDGDGSSRNPAYGSGTYGVAWPKPVSRGTGSGLATYLGTVRMSEIVAGHIPHAVGITTDMACGPAQTGQFRWPATTTDGTITSGTCVPEGARLQLDPSIDLSKIAGITKGELALGRALQTYGGIVNDIGGSRMSFYFEKPQPGQSDPYAAAGLTGDYFGFNKLPWNSLRVLATWDGS